MAGGNATVSFVMQITDKNLVRTHFHDVLPLLLDVSCLSSLVRCLDFKVLDVCTPLYKCLCTFD